MSIANRPELLTEAGHGKGWADEEGSRSGSSQLNYRQLKLAGSSELV